MFKMFRDATLAVRYRKLSEIPMEHDPLLQQWTREIETEYGIDDNTGRVDDGEKVVNELFKRAHRAGLC